VVLAAGEKLTASLLVQGIAPAPLAQVEVVRSGALVDGAMLGGRLDFLFESELEDLAPGEYVYARVLQENGGMAWSSPIFLVGDGAGG